ncbi:MAG: PaaI family thioesterase [Actinomycetota bacterium]
MPEPRPLPSHYHLCFGCGGDHPTGLRLEMQGAGDRVTGSFLVGEHHQGAPGLAHGGIVSAALDEAMAFLLWLVERPAVTAHMEVDFRRPVPTGSLLDLEAVLEGVDGRKILARGTARVGGEVVATGRAVFVEVGMEHFAPHAERVGLDAEGLFNP